MRTDMLTSVFALMIDAGDFAAVAAAMTPVSSTRASQLVISRAGSSTVDVFFADPD